MGRPYQKELLELPFVHDLVNQMDIQALTAWLKTASKGPLIAIGSGGSFTAAQMITTLHQKYSGQLAKSMTPLEASDSIDIVAGSSVVIFSSSGKNEDILSIAELIHFREPKQMLIICARQKSALEKLLSSDETVEKYTFDLKKYGDGYLATNSLYAFCLLLWRSYTKLIIDSTSSDLFSAEYITWQQIEEGIPASEEIAKSLEAGQRDTLVVLYSPTLKTGAVDLESRFTEAALGHTQLADLRNFAHGRHHWLAKRGDTSAVLCLTDATTFAFTEKTIKQLPDNIACAIVEFGDDIATAMLRSVIFSIKLALPYGNILGIDPGRPGVPVFGRRIYHLRGAYKSRRVEILQPDYIAIRRKLKGRPFSTTNLQAASIAHKKFRDNLNKAHFKGVVLDYDGTICRTSERYGLPASDINDALIHLAERGLLIGIATGRGDSVRDALRQSLPKHLWSRIIIGYYNCTQIGYLNDDTIPNKENLYDELEIMHNFLLKEVSTDSIIDIKKSSGQITLKLKQQAEPTLLDMIIEDLRIAFPSMNLVRSTHSFDILTPRGSKLRLFEELKICGCNPDNLLVIGDQGLWPGNDYALLSSPYSLSVDQVSLRLDSCWNIARPGVRGVSAALSYLMALQPDTLTSSHVLKSELL